MDICKAAAFFKKGFRQLRCDLFVQDLKKTSAAETDQPGGAAGGRNVDLVSAVQVDPSVSVKVTLCVEPAAVVRRDHFDRDAVTGRKYDAPVVEGVRADGCEQDQPCCGLNNGTAG